MTYKRYIKRGDKLFGPYYYKSYREGGVVKKKYLGANFYSNDKEPKKKINWVIFVLIIGLISILMILFLRASFQPSGKVVLHIDDSYKVNETITGNLNLLLKSGELLPEDTKVIINLAGEEKEYLLNDLLDINKSEGNFYAENINLSGEGGGYGFIGEIKTPVDVYFKLRIRQLKEGEIIEEENITEIENATEVENITETQGNITETEENITETQKNVSEEEVPEENITVEEKPEEKPKEEKKEITEEQIVEEVVQETLTEKGVEAGGKVESGQVVEESKKEKPEEKASETSAEAEASVSSESSGDSGASESSESSSDSGRGESSSSESSGDAGITGAVIQTNFFRNILSKFTGMKKYVINGKVTSINRITGIVISEIENTTQESLSQEEIQNIENKVEEKITEIKEKDNLIVDGVVNINSEFSYDLENKTAEIIEGSIIAGEEKLKEDVLDLKIKDNKAIVTTSYSKIEKGFGQEYLDNNKNSIPINLDKLNLLGKEGTLTIKLVYNNITIVEASKELSILIPKNITIISNLTTNLTLNITTNATIQTLQYQARLGKPVKWEKNIKLEQQDVVKVELPKLANNITVYKIVGEEEIEVKEGAITPVTNETPQTTTEITGIIGVLKENATIEENITSENVTGITPEVSGTENTTQITEEAGLKEIENTTETQVTEQAIEQTTQTAENITETQPEIIEKNKEGKKEVEVSKDKIEITGRIISGKISAEIELNKKPAITRFFTKIIKMITGRAIETQEQQEIIEVTIQDNATEYKVNYETPAPEAYEEETAKGKLITISAPDILNYTDILAYTYLPKEAQESKVKLYLITEETVNVSNKKVQEEEGILQENETELVGFGLLINKENKEGKINVPQLAEHIFTDYNILNFNKYIKVSFLPLVSAQETNLTEFNQTLEIRQYRHEVNFTAYDIDNNSLIDYIEWIVPHLSNETYLLIIEISKAEHLDENRAFISDIYEEVKDLDGNWSEPIYNNEYIRVTFSQNLTKDRDITVYARNTQQENTKIQIYEKEKNKSIAEFPVINGGGYYKVYLSNLPEDYFQDTFDLKIVNIDNKSEAYLDFDYIVDPADTTPPNISFVSPTPNNATTTSNTSIPINVSITESSLGSAIYNWNGTNYTYYNNSLILMYNFDSYTGTNDTSKYGNNGTLGNATAGTKPTWTASGKYGGAYSFDGVNDFINVPDSGSFNTKTLSICAWIKPAKLVDYGQILAKGENSLYEQFGILTTAAGTWYFQWGTASTSGGSLIIGSWSFVCGTTNGSLSYQYQDGVVISSGEDTSFYNSTLSLTIGKSNYIFGSRNFNGTIDEVRIWNRSLTAEEITQNYMANLNKYGASDWALYVNQSKNATTGLDNATYTYQAFASDTIPNWNSTDYRTITIGTADTTPPDINLTYPLNTTYTINVQFLNYTVASDATFCMYYNGTSNATITTCGVNLTNMVSSEGSQTWIVYANDSTGNQNKSSVTFVKDTQFPIFSSFTDNNATYSGQLARFNVTITSTNATVQLNLNATNYTASNLTATVFNVTINLTAVGDYNYTWLSWGNGSLHNYNTSSLRWFSVNSTIADTTPPTFTAISNNVSWIYPGTKFSVDFNATDNVAVSSFQINYTEKFLINSGTGVLTNSTDLGVGFYRINVSINDTSNNFAFLIYTVEVNQSNSANITLYLDGLTQNKTITASTKVYLNATLLVGDNGNLELYSNQSLINNGTSPATNYTNFTTTGNYNITSFYYGNENYSSKWTYNLWVHVNSIPGDTTNPTFTAISNNVSWIYSGTTFSVDFNATDETGFSSFQINYTEKFSINAGTGVLTNVTDLGVGIYLINVSINDTSNNFAFLLYKIEVNKTGGNVTIYLDGLSQNKSVYNGTKVYLNATLIIGDIGNIYLYNNQSLINNATSSPASNYTNFTNPGFYNITGYYTGSENYTENWSYSFYVNVSQTPDTTPPAFTDISNNKSFIYNTQGISADFNATDASGISSYFINWTEKFNISSNDGLLQNTTTLGVGIYQINVSVNDTSGNTGFLIYTIEVNKSNSANITLYLDGLTENKTIYSGTKVWLNATQIIGDNGAIIELYNNGTIINNGTSPIVNYTNFTGVGSYNITARYIDSQNYSTFGTYTLFVDVTQTPDTTPPAFTQISNNVSWIYPGNKFSVDFNATDETSFSSFQINWTEKFNITADSGILTNTTSLGVGIYKINVSINDTSNNFAFLIYTLEVNQSGATNLSLYLDGLSQNKTIYTGVKVWLNATLIVGDTNKNIYLYNNGSLINNGTSPVSNYTNFTGKGSYNISAYYLGDENWTANWSKNLFVDVSDYVDITPPTFTNILVNISYIYPGTGVSIDFNATDTESPISSFTINQTDKFNITASSGWIQNITTLNAGLWRVNVSVNDTSGNIGFLIYTIEVNKSGSNVTVYIDGLSQNKSVANGTMVWLNATLIQGDTGNIYLYNNQTLINNATSSPAVNYTNFTNLGDYNISSWYVGSENYTSNWSKIFFVNVTYTPATAATPVTTTEITGTGGGGGGVVAPITGLRVNPIGISLYGTAGISDKGKISLSNDKNTQITVGINLVNIGSMITLKETSIELLSGERKVLDFDYVAEKAGIYTGKVVFSSSGQVIQVPIALNIKSGKSLFDISVDIPEQYKQINPGNKLTSQITLIQAGTEEQIDVTLNYIIKDFEGKTHLKESETLAVEGQKSYSKEFQTQNLPVGDYLIGVEIIYPGGVATASSNFNVKESAIKPSSLLLFIVSISVIIVFILLIVLIKRYKKQNYFHKTSRIDKK